MATGNMKIKHNGHQFKTMIKDESRDVISKITSAEKTVAANADDDSSNRRHGQRLHAMV